LEALYYLIACVCAPSTCCASNEFGERSEEEEGGIESALKRLIKRQQPKEER
jgi:hypothetical protein